MESLHTSAWGSSCRRMLNAWQALLFYCFVANSMKVFIVAAIHSYFDGSVRECSWFQLVVEIPIEGWQ